MSRTTFAVFILVSANRLQHRREKHDMVSLSGRYRLTIPETWELPYKTVMHDIGKF